MIPQDPTPAPPPPEPRHSAPVRGLFFASGVACVVLAAIGVPVPGLPTTPFLLLAAFCFERSSPRLHRWLLRNKIFGPLIQQWQDDRTIDPRAKRVALIVIAVVFALSIWRVDVLGLRIMLLLIGLFAFVFVARLREARRD